MCSDFLKHALPPRFKLGGAVYPGKDEEGSLEQQVELTAGVKGTHSMLSEQLQKMMDTVFELGPAAAKLQPFCMHSVGTYIRAVPQYPLNISH